MQIKKKHFMTKKEIVNDVSKKTGITKEAVLAVIDEANETIADSLCKGETVFIRGLFTLSAVKRAPKHTRNIKKAETIISPAHYAPYAKFCKEIKKRVRKLPVE